MARLGRLAGYIEGLPLPLGGGFEVLPWERRFLRGIEATEGDAALSVGRGNGKSAICAGIAAAVVDPAGPWHGRGYEVTVAAATFEQGLIIFRDLKGYLGKYDLTARENWRKQESANNASIEHNATGSRCKVIGSKPGGAHGARPKLVLCDEPSQWEHPDAMLSVLRTGLGKVPGSRLIALGTRPEDEGHWFARMLEPGGCSYSQTHAAGLEDPPFQRRTWKRANPSLDHLPSLEKRLRIEAAEARTDPSKLASFRAMRLNLGTSDVAHRTLLDAATWARIEGKAAHSGPYALGIDLGTSAAMSAAAGFWPETGALALLGCFPTEPDLAQRGANDAVGRLYLDMERRGELILAGRYTTDVGELLRVAMERWGRPSLVAADAWRAPELREKLEEAKVPPAAFVLRRMGFKDGGEDVRDFRSACLTGRVVPEVSLLARAAMREARVLRDPAGNEKLAKNTEGGRRLRARDDAAAAGILGVATGARAYRSRRPSKGAYHGTA